MASMPSRRDRLRADLSARPHPDADDLRRQRDELLALITQAIDSEAGWMTAEDVMAFLRDGVTRIG